MMVEVVGLVAITFASISYVLKFMRAFMDQMEDLKETSVGTVPGITPFELQEIRRKASRKLFPDRHPSLHRFFWRRFKSYRNFQMAQLAEHYAAKNDPRIPRIKSQPHPPKPPPRDIAPISEDDDWIVLMGDSGPVRRIRVPAAPERPNPSGTITR